MKRNIVVKRIPNVSMSRVQRPITNVFIANGLVFVKVSDDWYNWDHILDIPARHQLPVIHPPFANFLFEGKFEFAAINFQLKYRIWILALITPTRSYTLRSARYSELTIDDRGIITAKKWRTRKFDQFRFAKESGLKPIE